MASLDLAIVSCSATLDSYVSGLIVRARSLESGDATNIYLVANH